jgi:CheY-like chemotaxis protein
MQSSQPEIDFIFVDDEEINNLICRMTVEVALGKKGTTTSFVNPALAFEHLKMFEPRDPRVPTVLLLDINMPVISGWEFLERFDNLPETIKGYIRIYILSSSVDQRDRERSYANKNVIDFLTKPLTKDTILQVAAETTRKA